MKKFIIFISICISGPVISQSVSPQVIGSSGDDFQATSSQLSWTLGETVTETFSTGTNYLSQGFHQTTLSATPIEDHDESLSFSVFPNPATEELQLMLNNSKELFLVKLFDVKGSLIHSSDLYGSVQTSINVSNISTGTYLLHLTDQNNKTIKVIKIQKSH